MKFCRNCGVQLLEDHQRYCRECGAAQTGRSTGKTRCCRNCGVRLSLPHQKYCRDCGAPQQPDQLKIWKAAQEGAQEKHALAAPEPEDLSYIDEIAATVLGAKASRAQQSASAEPPASTPAPETYQDPYADTTSQLPVPPAAHKAQKAESPAPSTSSAFSDEDAATMQFSPASQPQNAQHTKEAAAAQHAAPCKEKHRVTKRAHKGAKKLDKLTLSLILAAAVLLIFAGGMAIAVQTLHNTYDPGKTVTALLNAVGSRDTDALRSLLTPDGVSITDAGLTAFCRAFETDAQRAALDNQLRAEVANPDFTDKRYPAISIEGEKVFLGYQKYKIIVHSTQLLVPHVSAGIELTLDGTPQTGTAQDNGTLYAGIFPGQYSCVVAGHTATGQRIEGGNGEVTLFSVDAPITIDAALPIGDITVSGCLSDNAVILVDDIEVSQKPENGVVSLPQVAVGSIIKMQLKHEGGAVTTAAVQYTEKEQTQLQFIEHSIEGGMPSGAEINALLQTYFTSYIDAVNQKDLSAIRLSTEVNNSRISTEIAAGSENTLSFVSAAFDERTLQQSTYGITPVALFNATCTYLETPENRNNRPNWLEWLKQQNREPENKEMRLTIELIFESGEWKVNRCTLVSDGDFDAGTIAGL